MTTSNFYLLLNYHINKLMILNYKQIQLENSSNELKAYDMKKREN